MRLYFQWPMTGPVTSRFGAPRDYGPHVGLDIGGQPGTPVRAAAAGRVTAAGWISNAAGNGIKVDHGGGVSTSYFHLSRVGVSIGQSVSAGETIGASGATGRVTGPHLHFEVRRNGAATNPETALRTGVEYSGSPPQQTAGSLPPQTTNNLPPTYDSPQPEGVPVEALLLLAVAAVFIVRVLR